jgi:glutamate-1-semialdehyde 2,1-aminomutase
MSTGVEKYRAALSGSADLSEAATQVLAGGCAHDSWRLEPFAPAFVRSLGPYKWDVAQRRYVDFWMGHGALLLGHGREEVVEAVQRQVRNGTHFAGLHPLQIEWAMRIRDLVPSAERVRFTSSGTEATLLALRVARAFTGRQRIIRLDGHFHGWHDEALAHTSPMRTGGINEGAAEMVTVWSPFELEACIDDILSGEVAAIILEPGGGSSGSLPFDINMLGALRSATTASQTLLIFDEVISGFRYSPGGVQSLCGIIPDLTVLAKILAGGLPGGALVGSEAVMSVFASTDGVRRGRVSHSGTFNANPLAAIAGTTTLELVADGEAQRLAESAADEMVGAVNRHAENVGVDVTLFRQSSLFHILIGARARTLPTGPGVAAFALASLYRSEYVEFRRLLLLNHIDAHLTHGWMSNVHAPIMDEIIAAFDLTLRCAKDAFPPDLCLH